RRSLALVSRAVVIDAYAAVRRDEVDGCAAAAKIGVDVSAGDLSATQRKADRDASIGCPGDEVRGVLGRHAHADASVRGVGVKTSTVPAVSTRCGLDTAVGGPGVHVAGEIVQRDAAVGGLDRGVAVQPAQPDASIHGVELGCDMARHQEAVVHIPAAPGEQEIAGTVSVDRVAEVNFYLAREGFRVFPAACGGHDTSLKRDVIAVLAD